MRLFNLRLFSLGPTTRLTFGLLSLTVTLLLGIDMMLDIFPDQTKQEIVQRAQQSESIATQVTTLIMQYDAATAEKLLPKIVEKNPKLISVGVRTADKRLLLVTSKHAAEWQTGGQEAIGRDHFIVPISSAEQGHWGQVEIAFQHLPSGIASFITPSIKLMAIFSVLGALIFYLYLRRTLLHLDPSAAIPDRVQAAFDAMSDAIVVLDARKRIVMMNSSFNRLMPDMGENIISRSLESLPWLKVGRENVTGTIPWEMSIQSKRRSESVVFEAMAASGKRRRLITTASPLLDGQNNVKGCLVSFNDVSELDEANEQLVMLMADLTASKEKLELQNAELQRLAEVDPMTGARNRRAFFPEFERMFSEAKERNLQLAFIMSDIDKFKSVNDEYGHGIGDKVIQKFASILIKQARDYDIVCRYGGEEFCIALPGATLEQGMQVAERIRLAVQAEVGPSLPLNPQPVITASFGVSSVASWVDSASALADYADQALYESKHNGRNRCTSYSEEMWQSTAEKNAA